MLLKMLTLIGMPGSGKSTVGRALAERLGCEFIDTDPMIEAKHGAGGGLGDVLRELGRERFLDLESEVVRSLPPSEAVCAPGGSVIYRAAAMGHLRSLGDVLYLRVPLAELERRVGDLAARGVAGNEGGLAGLFAERTPLYERFATHTLAVEAEPVEATVRRAAALLGFGEVGG